MTIDAHTLERLSLLLMTALLADDGANGGLNKESRERAMSIAREIRALTGTAVIEPEA